MSTVLVTGASGFVGSRLVRRLEEHDIVALSRRLRTTEIRDPAREIPAHTVVRGDFASREDLGALDGHRIDVLVHLASEIGDCSEEAGLAVNVAGTRTLLRYLVDRGCRRFVLASSVAAVGTLSTGFIPERLPIPDDHPGAAVDAYGMSKALMEEVAHYFGRRHPEIEVTILRLGGASERGSVPVESSPLPYVIGGGEIDIDDAVEVFARAAERPLGPGTRRFNLVALESRTSRPVIGALAAAGADITGVDTSFYDRPGNERASLYTTDRLVDTFGVRTRLPAVPGKDWANPDP